MQSYTIITNSSTVTVEASHYARNRFGDYLLYEDKDTDQPHGEFPQSAIEGVVLTEFVEGVAR